MNKSVEKNQKKRGKKVGQPNTLTDKQIAESELLFYEHDNIVKVHEITGHSRPTLTKYMRAGKWRAKLKKIREAISRNIAKEVEKRGTKEALTDLEMVENLTRKVYTRVDVGLESILNAPDISDFDKLQRLKLLLSGKHDSNPGNASTINMVNYGNLTEDELDAKIKQRYKDVFAGSNGSKARI